MIYFIENTYTELILMRTMMIFFLCVITVPFFLTTFYYPPNPKTPKPRFFE